jgi:uncharacterized membrane protein YraQ (UPF0718 family)
MVTFASILHLIQSGIASLGAYLAAHVLLCLLPAFLIAGALSALFPKEAITRYLGKDAPKWLSYPAAALGGFVLAVCSCTIMPLFASIYKKGSGLGPAITFLFVGPAINILAISFTGVQIGMDIAIARVVLSLFFGITIGLIMAWVFRMEDQERLLELERSNAFSQKAKVPAKVWLFFGLLLAILIAGTLQMGLFMNSYFTFEVAGAWAETVQVWLNSVVSPNAALGIEGVSVHGLLLIGLLVLIGIFAMPGLNHVDEGFNRWTMAVLVLISVTLMVASFQVVVVEGRITFGVTGKLIAEVILIGMAWWAACTKFAKHELQDWLWETWRFVRQIIPLLLVGVFLAGVARQLIPAAWVESVAGRNTILANFVGVVFGVFMYFPTLVEVPVAQTFLSLGMHRGPLLAYLLADPELSLQSILITNSVIGKKKTALYVGLVSIFSTLAGYLFGMFLSRM